MSGKIGVVVCLLPAAALVQGQTAGTIAGHVRTAAGDPLVEAVVTARDRATGFLRRAATSAEGLFVLASLPAGRYDIGAEKAGFHTLTQTGVSLSVGETLTVEFSLTPGVTAQEITVEARTPLVNSQTSELSYLVSDAAMRLLPLNGRNYTDLALLQPGVTAYPHRDGGSVVAHGLGMSINGQDPRSNVYLLDGTPMNDFTNGPAGSAASTALGMETIREFRVETNAYSAEFGRMYGGQITALTKSGTNDLHGSVFGYHRNDNMDARNFFDPSRKPEFKRNQFGGTVGGPIQRDRTFFFAGYEALRERLGRTIQSVTPDENARRGLIPDPANPGALLNVGVHPAVAPYLAEYPLPNGENRGLGLGLYTFNFGQRLRQDFGQARLDRRVGAGGQMFVRYTADDASQLLPTDFPQFPRSFVSRNQFLTAQYEHVLTPRTLNTVRAGFSRTRVGQDVEANTATPLAPFVPGRGMPGNIDIGGASRWGPQSSVNVQLTQNVFTVEDNLTLIRGRHAVKAGAMLERYRDNMLNPTFSLGIHAFADLRAFLENRPLRFVGLAPGGEIDRYWRFWLAGIYVQDDFHLSPRVTINAGLRYEYTTMPVDLYGRDSGLVNLSDPEPFRGRLYSGPPKRNLSPRVGFAWDVGGNGRTSIRAAYAWLFNTNNHQNLIVTVTNPPATPRLIIPAGSTFPTPPFERGIGNTMRPIEWNIKNPNLHSWNASVQRQLPWETLLSVAYAGSRGLHLWRNTDINIPAPAVLADGTQFWAAGLARPNPRFGAVELKRSDGDSWRQALMVEVRRRWRSGFSVQSSYTWSRNIDTTQASTFFSDATNGNVSAMPEFFGLEYNRGLADYHAKHNWVVNAMWELPGALRGWQMAAMSSVRSGNPLTVFVTQNRSRSLWNPSVGPGIGLDRPSMAPGYTHESAVPGDPNQWFDRRAFVLQPAGTLGNLGRGSLIGPNLRGVDLALGRSFRMEGLGEGGSLQFRVEAFNVFNRANFGTPGLAAFAGARDDEAAFPSLGLVRSTVTSSRQVQVGVRIGF